jgi:hypothetical protein
MPGRWETNIPQRDSEGSGNSREAPWLLRHRSHSPGGQDTIKASRFAQEKVQHLLHAKCIFLHRIALARFGEQKELHKSFFTIRDVSKKTLSDSIQYWLDMDQVLEGRGWLIGYPDHVNWIELRRDFKTIGRQPELLEPIFLDELPGRLLIIGPHNQNYKRAVSKEEKDIHEAVCQKVMDTPVCTDCSNHTAKWNPVLKTPLAPKPKPLIDAKQPRRPFFSRFPSDRLPSFSNPFTLFRRHSV